MAKNSSKASRAAVIGAGPAGLMASEILAREGVAVTIYERMPSPARKFLLAGRGGLNITHSESFEAFASRYGARTEELRPLLQAFSPDDMRTFCAELGEECFTGSSGRVFPRSFKTSPLLRAWLRRLEGLGVRISYRHRFTGWRDGALLFDTPEGTVEAQAEATILALGGASWPRLGSTGDWVQAIRDRGVDVADLLPANCGFETGWSDHLRERFSGTPLKTIALEFAGHCVRGECVIASYGLEGGAIYALSGPLRDAIARDGQAQIAIDLKPDVTEEELARRLAKPRGSNSLSNHLRKSAGLTPAMIALLREPGPLPREPDALAQRIKKLPVTLNAIRPIERAISTAGGIRFEALDAHMMTKAMPGVFVAGEMLDWEAPTGGYLLQASFATGAAAARGALQWLAQTADQS